MCPVLSWKKWVFHFLLKLDLSLQMSLGFLLELLLCCCHCLGDKSQAFFLRISESIPKLAPVLLGRQHPAVLCWSWDRLGMPLCCLLCLGEGSASAVEAVQERQMRGSLRSDWKQLPGVITGLWLLWLALCIWKRSGSACGSEVQNQMVGNWGLEPGLKEKPDMQCIHKWSDSYLCWLFFSCASKYKWMKVGQLLCFVLSAFLRVLRAHALVP